MERFRISRLLKGIKHIIKQKIASKPEIFFFKEQLTRKFNPPFLHGLWPSLLVMSALTFLLIQPEGSTVLTSERLSGKLVAM